jgi:hypothetical protein
MIVNISGEMLDVDKLSPFVDPICSYKLPLSWQHHLLYRAAAIGVSDQSRQKAGQNVHQLYNFPTKRIRQFFSHSSAVPEQ